MDKHEERLINGLVARSMAAEAFMLEIAVRLGAAAPDKARWSVEFISNLHERLDSAEAGVGEPDPYGWHEGARQQIDRLGAMLQQILQLPPR